jgi:hypothetical protein
MCWQVLSGGPGELPTHGQKASIAAIICAVMSASKAVLVALRSLITRILLLLVFGFLTVTSVPAWGESPQSRPGSFLHTQDIHLVARADEQAARSQTAPATKLHDNLEAWHKAWGGKFDELPLWTRMARERVVMEGLRAGESASAARASECQAVWMNPLKYLYVMSHGSIKDRSALLASFPAPSRAPLDASTSGLESSTDVGDGVDGRRRAEDSVSDTVRHSTLMREALQVCVCVQRLEGREEGK